MPAVRHHRSERDRLDSLHSYAVLDTPAERSFDALTTLAADLCDTPRAALTLVDRHRQWNKSTFGSGACQLPRAQSLCSDVVAAGAPLVVPDTRRDPRYRGYPEVLSGTLRAYAGVPLVGRDGLPLGALNVSDRRPRRFSAGRLEQLAGLAHQAAVLLEQHRRDHDDGLLDRGLAVQVSDGRRLRLALDRGELVPHYQPIVDLHTGRTHGMEALLRWEHPQLGLLPPAAFLPLLERSALVVAVGRAVLDSALQTLAGLDRRGLRLPGGVSVNIASGQLARPGLARDVLAALRRHGLEPGRLALEITESTELPDRALALAELTTLTDAGVRLLIDDYGVGWSNLTRVLQLPAAALKLDRSLVRPVLTDPRAAAMVSTTMALAADLGLDVVAEGIDQEALRDHLLGVGCHYGQGWLFNPALPATALARLLTAHLAQPGSCPTTGTQPSP